MFINYKRTVGFSTEIINAGFNQDGQITCAQKTTAGAPANTPNKYIAGALVQNTADGLWYRNNGTYASPNFVNDSSDLTLPFADTDATSTTGSVFTLTASALTTGKVYRAIAAAANLTGAGRYFEANDGAANVFGIGPNGHIHSAQTTAPTIAVTIQNGITNAAITAGSSDTCGIITTTGTNNNGGGTVLDVTFNKTYTVAPKSISLTPLNSSAAKSSATTLLRPWISAISATGFTITIPADASAGATPSFSYQVIA